MLKIYFNEVNDLIYTDVIVVGGGPTGVMAANILGRYGLKTIVFDKLKDIYPLPRAAVIDDDIARIIQFAGLEEDILKLSTVSKGYKFLNQQNSPMFGFKRNASHTSNGYPTSLVIRQPLIEEVLRSGLKKHENILFYSNHEVLDVEERNDLVTVKVKDLAAKEEKSFQAKYVIAADGARSKVRECIGIEREDMNFNHPWLIVDIKAPKELDLPTINQQYCHPSRAATCIYLGNDMYRWEIALHEHETQSTYKTDESIKELLSNWMSTEDITVDRKIIYVFRSLLAKQGRKGRIFLAGDSAHQMPPFLGQGLSSGIRDAVNICWKIAHILKYDVNESILDSYEKERMPHVEKIMRHAVLLGEIIQTNNQEIADFRDRLFNYLNSIPNVREALSNLVKAASPIGIGFHHPTIKSDETTLFPQTTVTLADGTQAKSDNVIGGRFALIVSANVSENKIEELKQKLAALHLTDFFVCLQVVTQQPVKAEEVLEEIPHFSEWFDKNSVDAAIVRPDRYVYAKGAAEVAGDLLEDLAKSFGIKVMS
ncbi:bifunctional 3-(3-hydroxy-phenyl)propionate/3-hydroxycinnamic acid hydroxylase [Bacillus sp. FJAT-29953]|nr:bifunctional 3-(3-hydroxy-phenyl)propionate/3-hydroxycinnamic acid hydroxylase [Bacillus sp. FJAT-29953]